MPNLVGNKMNQFKSGTLLVIAATVITAILMLTTTRVTSTTKEEIVETNNAEVETEVVTKTVASTESEDVKPVIVEDKNTEEKSVPSNNVDKVTLIAKEPKEVAAPEGPYGKSETEVETKEVANTNTDTTSEKTDSKDTENIEQADEPIKAESINVVATSTQHDLLNHLIQPIWMDQKLGDFKSIENREVVFKIMPTTPDGLQGQDPQQVVTDKSDKFAQTTVSADYNYQQMPMYNGGYYIAPMPPYLMESMLPISEPVKTQ